MESIREKIHNGEKRVLTLQEYKAMRDERPVNFKNVDYKPRRALTETMEAILVGFDPDVDSSGVVVYDARNHSVLYSDIVELRYIYDWVNSFKSEMEAAGDIKRVFCRLELTNEAVAHGITKQMSIAMAGKMPKEQLEKKVFKRIWDSAQNARIGFEIEKELQRARVPYELINPSRRLNLFTRKMAGKDGALLLSEWRKEIVSGKNKKWRIFPTKMGRRQVEYFFGKFERAGGGAITVEEIDAIGLFIPEVVINRMTGKIK